MIRVAVVGAGWAGAAAALTLARAGVQVTVFEASRIAGGRARKIEKDDRIFDNGQHLLLGAYERSIALIESLHSSIDNVVQRLPLALCTAPASPSPLELNAPRVRAPFNLLAAVAGASGLSVADKFSMILWSAHHLRTQTVDPDTTVAALLAEQTESARRLLWEPLCIAALNTPAPAASASVFIEVLRRTFTGSQAASDLIIPRVNLSLLVPEPALAEVAARGNSVQFGAPITSITQSDGTVTVSRTDASDVFDRVILATGPQHISRLLATEATTETVVNVLRSLRFEPITTHHFEFACVWPEVATDRPMLMLDGEPGQWLFWQRQRNGHWRASVVISAHHRSEDDAEAPARTLTQLRRSYQLPQPVWQQSITEKRATYACTPGQTKLLSSLPKQVGVLHFAGDWCLPELPATLEAAVVSGENAARAIIHGIRQ